MAILISRETGGDKVPPELLLRLINEGSSLQSSTSPTLDKAIKNIAMRMSQLLSAPLVENPYRSDLINVAKPTGHRNLYSARTRAWPKQDRQHLVNTIHAPYRTRLRQSVADMLRQHPYVIHLSVSTFQSINSKGKHRRTDAGLLYDPSNDDETSFCIDWLEEMFFEVEMLKVRRNYPWRGTRDSVTRSLRAEFAQQGYLGIELVLNRSWAWRNVKIRDLVIDGICETLQEICPQTKQEAA